MRSIHQFLPVFLAALGVAITSHGKSDGKSDGKSLGKSQEKSPAGSVVRMADGSDLRVAADSVDITPKKPVFLAGYASNRRSTDAHDRLMARCLVMEAGGVRIAIVACDLIGLPRFQCGKIRLLVRSVTPDNLFIAATHTHSGPDTMGQWGPDIQTSGVDQEWMADLRQQVARLVDSTSARLKPATLKFANTTDVPRISRNVRVAEILDKELAVMQAVGKTDGKPIATLVNYACHPEVLNNSRITADFPHWLYETVEKTAGGVCLYLNGAQGGMVTADYDESSAPRGQNWQAAEIIGTSMGQRAIQLLEKAVAVSDAPIRVQHRTFRVPLENQRFKALIALRVFPREAFQDGMIETEVHRFTVGPAEFLTLPGEVLPNIGFYLKRHMKGSPKFLLGLTCDELGYILTPEDYGLKLYSYETSVSVGSQMEPLMVKNLLAMITETAGSAAKATDR